MKLPISRTKLWLVLIALILFVGLSGQLPAAQANDPTRDQLDSAMHSTMKVYTLDSELKIVATCTGTVIDPAGYVLTNFHCVGVTTGEGESEGTPGTFYNPQGVVALGPTLDAKKAPKPTYFAKFVAGNYDLDVAVLKIVAMVNKDEKLPKTLPLNPIVRSDSDQVQIGDYVGVIGYPGVGGNTVTFTDGKISGYDDMNKDGVEDSFKVTASINPGNSGGLSINGNGEQIGIPTWFLYNAKSGSKLDRILMINVAEPYIQKALNVSGITGDDIRSSPPPSNPPPKTGPTGNAAFTNVRFGTDYANGKLTGAAQAFPAGTTTIVGVFDFAGMKKGADWGEVWSIDGDEAAGKRTGLEWKAESSGTYSISLNNGGKALPNGKYKLTLYLNGTSVGEGNATIGQSAQPTPPPKSQPPPTQKGSTSVLSGQVVDASTQRGIPAAVLMILKPGTTVEQFSDALDNDTLESIMLASAITDEDGAYQTAPGVARGAKYSVVFIAAGYQGRFFQDGLEIASNDPAVVKMKPISLQKR